MMQEIDRGTVVFYYHNVTPPDLWRARAGRESQQQGMSRKALVHYADLCITASPFNKQDLVEQVGFEPDRIHVLPLAVPLDRFTPARRTCSWCGATTSMGRIHCFSWGAWPETSASISW